MDNSSENVNIPQSTSEGSSPVETDAINLSPELADALKNVDPDHRAVLIHYFRQTHLSSFTGPIPPPEVLQGYENVKQGFADRILTMAEKQQDHRISSESKMIKESANETSRGQWFGFIIAISFLVGAVILGLTGHEWLGGVIGGGTLVSLVTVFLTNRPAKKSEDVDDSKQ